jgi:hypothetical protein
VTDLHPEAPVEVLGQEHLLLRAGIGPARLDEADPAARPAQRLEVLEHLPGEQVTHVLSERQAQRGVRPPEQGPQPLLEDALRAGEHVEPSHSAEVRLEELQRALPLRAFEEGRRVEPSEYRVPRPCSGPQQARIPPLRERRGAQCDTRVGEPQLEQSPGRLVR